MSNVLIVGGERDGEYIKWFGNRVNLNREMFVLHHVYFTDGTRREYYVREDICLATMIGGDEVLRIEVRK